MSQDPCSLLVVEDDEVLRAAMVGLLKLDTRVGDIYEVGTLQDAIALLRQTDRIDVIVLDLLLPDCSGAETLWRLSDQFPEVPIVVCTGMPLDSAFLDELTVAGAFAIMDKDKLFVLTLSDWVARAYLHRRTHGLLKKNDDA